MPSVIDQAVPSEVQSTMGSLFRLSPLASGNDVWFQVAPPSVELNWAWEEFPMSFDAAMIFCGSP